MAYLQACKSAANLARPVVLVRCSQSSANLAASQKTHAAVALRGTADGKNGHFLSCVPPPRATTYIVIRNKKVRNKIPPPSLSSYLRDLVPHTGTKDSPCQNRTGTSRSQAKISPARRIATKEISLDAAKSAPRHKKKGDNWHIVARCDWLTLLGLATFFFFFFITSLQPNKSHGDFPVLCGSGANPEFWRCPVRLGSVRCLDRFRIT